MTRVLLVDDDDVLAEVLHEFLTEEGYETHVAHDGRDALRQLAERQPDVVLSDVMLPFLSGLELAQAMVATPAYRRIPLILMTAGGQDLVPAGTPHAALVAKPFDFSRLLATLEQVVGRRP
jgi:CheY-like chemotaxis protein